MRLEQFRTYTAWNGVANERAYEAPADPAAPIAIDPTALDRHTQTVDLQWGLGRVDGGDWDREAERYPLDETTAFRALRQRFEEGRDWAETALYERAEAAFEDENSYRGYESLDEFLSIRCAHLDDLYRDIEQNGYRPNHDADHETPADGSAFENAYVHHLEPLVVVARDGELLLTEGFHRVAIAAIQDLDWIPVQVLCRHVEWQRTRDRLHGRPREDWPADLPGHSDLRDLPDAS